MLRLQLTLSYVFQSVAMFGGMHGHGCCWPARAASSIELHTLLRYASAASSLNCGCCMPHRTLILIAACWCRCLQEPLVVAAL
jgi:hypothetical protein